MVSTVALLVALVGALAGCGGATSREDALAAVVDDVAVPAQQDFADASEALQDQAAAWCDDGADMSARGAGRDDLRTALADALAARHHQLAASGGPTTERTSMALVDWPIDPAAIEQLAAGSEPVTAEKLRNGAAGRRGLYAVEHLAFGFAGQAPQRCDYLVAATTVVAAEADRLVTAWEDGVDDGSPYRDELLGEASVSLGTRTAVEEFVREEVFLADGLVDGLLADALGDQDAMETPREGPAGAGPAIVAGALDGLEAVHDPARFGSQLSQAQRAGLLDAITAAHGDLDGMTSLREADPADLEALRDDLERVRTSLRTDVVMALDVTVGFSDNDGDSG